LVVLVQPPIHNLGAVPSTSTNTLRTMEDLTHLATAGQNEKGKWAVMILVENFTDEADAKTFEKDFNEAGGFYFEEIVFTPE